jgi:hypothetical protein
MESRNTRLELTQHACARAQTRGIPLRIVYAILGGHSRQCRLGHRQHQRRRALHLRHLLARRLRRHHGRLGVEFEISIPRRDALGGADGLLRGLDRLRHHHRPIVRRLAQPHRYRRGAEHFVGAHRLVLAAAPAQGCDGVSVPGSPYLGLRCQASRRCRQRAGLARLTHVAATRNPRSIAPGPTETASRLS